MKPWFCFSEHFYSTYPFRGWGHTFLWNVSTGLPTPDYTLQGVSHSHHRLGNRHVESCCLCSESKSSNCKYDIHKINFHLNKRYFGLLECDAAASNEWFPTFRKKVSPSFSRVMWTKVFDLWVVRRYFLSTRREHSPEDRASYPGRWASSVTRLLCTTNSQPLFSQRTETVRQPRALVTRSNSPKHLLGKGQVLELLFCKVDKPFDICLTAHHWYK